MNIDLHERGMRSPTPIVWACRIVLVAYGILMLSGYWSQLADTETTVRLVGSDVGCSLSAIDCNWFNFILDKIVGVAAIGFAGAAQFLSKWRHRNRVQVAAAIVAIVHVITLQMLLSTS